MGAWGELAFDNDAAGDWADGLDEVHDLSLVEAAFDEVEEVGDGYLEMESACNALAACEVLARLLGHPGYQSASTEVADRWVAAHKLTPSAALLKRALHAIDRILDTPRSSGNCGTSPEMPRPGTRGSRTCAGDCEHPDIAAAGRHRSANSL